MDIVVCMDVLDDDIDVAKGEHSVSFAHAAGDPAGQLHNLPFGESHLRDQGLHQAPPLEREDAHQLHCQGYPEYHRRICQLQLGKKKRPTQNGQLVLPGPQG